LKNKKKVLIIIPAFNEENNIGGVIEGIKQYHPDFDLLVINDGSKDNTSQVAKETGKAVVIDLSYNLGIGAAVQTGFKYAKRHIYDVAMQFDGDGQHMVSEIIKVIGPVINNETDCMIGSRFVENLESFKSSILRRLGIHIFEWVSLILIGQKIKDQTSGFRAFNKDIIHFLADYYPRDYPEPEVIILLGKNKFRIKEVFTQMRERQGGISSIPNYRGPYYMMKVLLSMFMAAIRERKREEIVT